MHTVHVLHVYRGYGMQHWQLRAPEQQLLIRVSGAACLY